MNNVLEYLEHSAALYPDKMAFADETTRCTYRELQEQARIAGSRLAGRVQPGRPVPVLMEKSVSAVALFMGIVYAGCFYVMLDAKQPAVRLQQILKTLECDLIVSGRSYEAELEKLDFQGEAVFYEDLTQGMADEKVLQDIRRQALDIDPLYGIFTSGSTGIPKGVVVSHRSVIDFMEYFTDLFGITGEDVIGNQAPFDFDVSVKDIYSTLKTGATMQIIPRRMFSFPTQLLDYLCEREVTTLIWAVSALCIITTLNGFDYRVPSKISKVLFSGEVMPIRHLNKWREIYPEALFVNLYGPTEITCNCTYYKVDREFQPGGILPIGQAFPNEKVFLLGEDGSLITEPGEKGELCVSGTCLSMGYFNNREQTEKAFVQNPLNPYYQETIYLTGDLAYYNEDRELCFASRKDFQIKHMGQRIELGEVEAGIETIPEIRRVCCIFDESAGRITAFYEGDIEKKEIVRQLRTRLPAYMIPGAFCRVDAMPLTKNGKIDRACLKNSMEGELNGR